FFCVFEQMQWLRKLLFEPFRSSRLTRVVLAAAMCSAAELLALRLRHQEQPFEHATNRHANSALKSIRRVYTNADGQPVGVCARGPPGLDLTQPEALQGTPQWRGADRGPAGRWEEGVTLPFNWRHWLAALPQETFDRILQGHGVLAFGCRPIVGTTDPLPSMRGPVWDFYVVLESASMQCVYLHPSQKGPLLKITWATDEGRAANLGRCARGGLSVKERSLYPGGLPPRRYPHPPQREEDPVDPAFLFGCPSAPVAPAAAPRVPGAGAPPGG
ncbi:MAG: hypothetical protein GY772_30625, partial [bacterium]|nr:hypothetical protein [bacterium]